MSRDAREWVWEHSTSRGNARVVLLSIADRVPDEQCIAWASLTSLEERSRASRSTVREALDRLLAAGELEELEDLTGPQRSTVYRMPLAAKAVAATAAKEADAAAEADLSDGVRLRVAALRQYGIRPREVPESATTCRKPAGPDSGPSARKPAHRRPGNRHTGVPETGTQNRSEPKVNRNSSGAAPVSADEWQVDPATHAWACDQGHLDRLGEEGLAAADAKWRAHRADWKPRSADAWAADWRSWVAREHTPGRPNLYALPGNGSDQPRDTSRPAARAGRSRAQQGADHLAAALARRTAQEATP